MERPDESMNMGARLLENTLFAYLGEDDVPVLCTRARAYSWLRVEGGLHRSCIRRDGIDGLIIYTQFQHFSSEPDVPMFWEVNWYSLSPYRSGERRFGTKKEALEFHNRLVREPQLLERLTEDHNDKDGADWWKE